MHDVIGDLPRHLGLVGDFKRVALLPVLPGEFFNGRMLKPVEHGDSVRLRDGVSLGVHIVDVALKLPAATNLKNVVPTRAHGFYPLPTDASDQKPIAFFKMADQAPNFFGPDLFLGLLFQDSTQEMYEAESIKVCL